VLSQLRGTYFSIYPRGKAAEGIAPAMPPKVSGFAGMTLAHNTREKTEADTRKLAMVTRPAGSEAGHPAA